LDHLDSLSLGRFDDTEGSLMNLSGRQVLVMGMGRSGEAAARCALRQGATVTCTDTREDAPIIEGASHTYGHHDINEFTDADLVIVSPGIPAKAEPIQAAIKAGVPVLSELAFAGKQVQKRNIPIIAVTGTNGKSSVTWFIGQLLKQAGREAFVGGNIGTPLSMLADSDTHTDFAVVEVSSYQLELPGEFSPQAAAILNLAPDHLGRHGTMSRYAKTKMDLFTNMKASGFAAIPPISAANPDGLLGHAGTTAHHLSLAGSPGIRRSGDVLTLSGTPDDGEIDLSSLQLLGEHNRDNAAAAALLCVCAGLPRKDINVGVLSALPHRLEPVHTGCGITWINDSKATNIDAAFVGISGVDKPVIVLLGGAGKPGSDYARLRPLLDSDSHKVICFGAAGNEIADALELSSTERVSTLSDAVHLAAKLAQSGDVVLLSPACASFDEFDNFEHRGHVFAAMAQEASP
jgi:UDP-N-acetylmuramoylalanine--D-glutamate ligase